jgi:uncharacterized SAM-binding protein YcdF (DUF218 family)
LSLAAGCGAVSLVAVAEIADWWARIDRTGTATAEGRTTLVVLGLPGNNPAMRSVQRWRVAMALRARTRWKDATVVFTGGSRHGAASEASQMADVARQRGLSPDAIVLEEEARTTWENVSFSHRLTGDVDLVVLVSDGLHAERARRYWMLQHPQSSTRVIADLHYRFLDHVWLKTPSTLAQLWRLVRNCLT